MSNKFQGHTNPPLSNIGTIDKPTIGVDLDGVLCATRNRFIDEIESLYDINIKVTRTGLSIPQLNKNYGELVQEIVNNNYNIYNSIEPIKGASEAINRLSEDYKIKIITHRVHRNWLNSEKRDRLKSLSINWLDDNDIYFDEFIFPTPKDKSEVPAEIYIDDRVNNINDIINRKKIGILFLRPDNINSAPWGAWLASSEENVDMNYMAQNEKEQWEIIRKALM